MTRVLAVTGGHRVDLDAFAGLLGRICAERGWVFAHAVQPSAQGWLRPAYRGSFDAILCHDIPGLHLRRGERPRPVGPAPAVARDLVALLDDGQGFVFLHHALAGWPGWPGWAEVLGGRYHYAPGRLRGTDWPDSGYRHTRHTVSVAAPDHPVCAGVADFTVEDEVYCCPVFEADVVPLLRTNADRSPEAYRQTLAEVLGTEPEPEPGPGPRPGQRTQAQPWAHSPASDLVGWAKTAGASPVVYLQPGDGPSTFADPMFARLLGNALGWVGSDEAHAWAAANRTTIPVGA